MADTPVINRIRAFNIRLEGIIQFPGDFRDTALVRPCRKIDLIFQKNTPTDLQGYPVFFQIDIISGSLVHGSINTDFIHVFGHSFCKFLLGQRIIFFRHPDVIQDIFITRFRDQQTARQLLVLVRELRYDFKLFRFGIKIQLKITPVQLSALKHHILDKPLDLVIIRIEIERGVREIVYREFIAVLTRGLRASNRGYFTGTSWINTGKEVFLRLLHDTEVGILFYIAHATG